MEEALRRGNCEVSQTRLWTAVILVPVRLLAWSRMPLGLRAVPSLCIAMRVCGRGGLVAMEAGAGSDLRLGERRCCLNVREWHSGRSVRQGRRFSGAGFAGAIHTSFNCKSGWFVSSVQAPAVNQGKSLHHDQELIEGRGPPFAALAANQRCCGNLGRSCRTWRGFAGSPEQATPRASTDALQGPMEMHCHFCRIGRCAGTSDVIVKL